MIQCHQNQHRYSFLCLWKAGLVNPTQHYVNSQQTTMATTNWVYPFDPAPAARGCWETCRDNASIMGYMDRVDQAVFPMYRDPETLGQFMASARHFTCVELCENDFFGKRINLFLLIGVCGESKTKYF